MMGYVFAYITDIKRAEDVVRQVRQIEGVTKAYLTYGTFDIVAKLDTNDLTKTVLNGIHLIPGIGRTCTTIVDEKNFCGREREDICAFISAGTSKLGEVMDALKRIVSSDYISFGAVVYGPYDIVLEITEDARDDIFGKVIKYLSEFPIIVSVTTQITVSGV